MVKNKLTIALAVALLVSGGFWLTKPTEQQVVERVVERAQSLGAVSGPDIQSPYLGWGQGQGNTWKFRADFNSASSTMCVSQIPPTATSTIARISVIPSSATSTDRLIYIATSTIPFAPPLTQATSSLITRWVLPANSQDAGVWLPLPAVTVATSYVNATNTAQQVVVANPMVGGVLSTTSATYVIVGFRGGGAIDSGTGATPSGTCGIIYEQF